MSEDKSELVAIEIGPRTNPYLREIRHDLIPKDSKALYIEKRSYSAKNLQEEGKIEEGKDIILQGDGTKLPVGDNSVGAILAKDVFGAMDQKFLTRSSRLSSNLETLVPISTFAKEWYRASKGNVIIMETATPRNIDEVKKGFLDAGFKLKEEYRNDDVVKVLDIYDPEIPVPKDMFFTGAYALVFEKP